MMLSVKSVRRASLALSGTFLVAATVSAMPGAPPYETASPHQSGWRLGFLFSTVHQLVIPSVNCRESEPCTGFEKKPSEYCGACTNWICKETGANKSCDQGQAGGSCDEYCTKATNIGCGDPLPN